MKLILLLLSYAARMMTEAIFIFFLYVLALHSSSPNRLIMVTATELTAEPSTSIAPTLAPTTTLAPSAEPTTFAPSSSISPSLSPSLSPSFIPTEPPTVVSSFQPSTFSPSYTFKPTNAPTNLPSSVPSPFPSYSMMPSETPTTNPTANPTADPTANPTRLPTPQPSSQPSSSPTLDISKHGWFTMSLIPMRSCPETDEDALIFFSQLPTLYTAYAIGSCVFVNKSHSFSYSSCDALSVDIKEYASHNCESNSLISSKKHFLNETLSDHCTYNTLYQATVYFNCTNFNDDIVKTPVPFGNYVVRRFYDATDESCSNPFASLDFGYLNIPRQPIGLNYSDADIANMNNSYIYSLMSSSKGCINATGELDASSSSSSYSISNSNSNISSAQVHRPLKWYDPVCKSPLLDLGEDIIRTYAISFGCPRSRSEVSIFQFNDYIWNYYAMDKYTCDYVSAENIHGDGYGMSISIEGSSYYADRSSTLCAGYTASLYDPRNPDDDVVTDDSVKFSYLDDYLSPTPEPSEEPTSEPSSSPTPKPSTARPTYSQRPSPMPTAAPTTLPPTAKPTLSPTFLDLVILKATMVLSNVSYNSIKSNLTSFGVIVEDALLEDIQSLGLQRSDINIEYVSDLNTSLPSSSSSSSYFSSSMSVTYAFRRLAGQQSTTSNVSIGINITCKNNPKVASYSTLSTAVVNSVTSGNFTKNLRSLAITRGYPYLAYASSIAKSLIVSNGITPPIPPIPPIPPKRIQVHWYTPIVKFFEEDLKLIFSTDINSNSGSNSLVYFIIVCSFLFACFSMCFYRSFCRKVKPSLYDVELAILESIEPSLAKTSKPSYSSTSIDSSTSNSESKNSSSMSSSSNGLTNSNSSFISTKKQRVQKRAAVINPLLLLGDAEEESEVELVGVLEGSNNSSTLADSNSSSRGGINRYAVRPDDEDPSVYTEIDREENQEYSKMILFKNTLRVGSVYKIMSSNQDKSSKGANDDEDMDYEQLYKEALSENKKLRKTIKKIKKSAQKDIEEIEEIDLREDV